MKRRYNAMSRTGVNIFSNLIKRELKKRKPTSKIGLLFSQSELPSKKRLAKTFVRDISNFLGHSDVVETIHSFGENVYIVEDGDRRAYILDELHWFDDFVDADNGIEYPHLALLFFNDNGVELKVLAVLNEAGDILHYYKLEGDVIDGESIQTAFRDRREVFVIENAGKKTRKKTKKNKRKSIRKR